MLEHIVLGTVYDEPHTGYEIKREIEDSIGIIYRASFGSLYPLLKRLSDRKLIKETGSDQTDAGGRIKKYYQITAAGKKYFHEWLAEPMVFPDTLENQLGKIFFFGKLTKQERKQQFDSYEKSIAEFREKLQDLHAACMSKSDSEHDYYHGAIVSYGQMMLDNLERWCENVKKEKKLF
jgi:DNA-binding PadR family transcriptional regulator